MSGGSSNNNLNTVFYAENYHPIQAGSIDGTNILPHDNTIYRALLCSSAGLYDPFGDPKVIGDLIVLCAWGIFLISQTKKRCERL